MAGYPAPESRKTLWLPLFRRMHDLGYFDRVLSYEDVTSNSSSNLLYKLDDFIN